MTLACVHSSLYWPWPAACGGASQAGAASCTSALTGPESFPAKASSRADGEDAGFACLALMAALPRAGSLRQRMLAGLLAFMELTAAQGQVLPAHARCSELRSFVTSGGKLDKVPDAALRPVNSCAAA